MSRSTCMRSTALWTVLLATTLSAQAGELISNGGFEANVGLTQSPDNITGWHTLEGGLIGSIASLPDTTSPGSGHTTVGAGSGSNYALLDLSQPAYSVLYQNFTVPTAGVSGGQLSYSLFATSYANLQPPELTPFSGLNFESSEPLLTVRVDILKPGADLLSTNNADLIKTYFPTVEYFGSDAAPTGYHSYLHSLSGVDLLAGQTYTLRFSAAANTAQALVGIDNVSLTVSSVPEPTTLALLGAGLAVIGLASRRRA